MQGQSTAQVYLTRRERITESFSSCTQWKSHVKTQEVSRKAASETQPEDTVFMDLWPPELQENKFLLFRPSTTVFDYGGQNRLIYLIPEYLVCLKYVTILLIYWVLLSLIILCASLFLLVKFKKLENLTKNQDTLFSRNFLV